VDADVFVDGEQVGTDVKGLAVGVAVDEGAAFDVEAVEPDAGVFLGDHADGNEDEVFAAGEVEDAAGEFLGDAGEDGNDVGKAVEGKENGKPERIDSYTPFQNYTRLTTPDGKKLYTEDFSVKAGVTDSFVSLTDLHLEDDLFSSEVRVGILRRSTEEGFFKKEYRTADFRSIM